MLIKLLILALPMSLFLGCSDASDETETQDINNSSSSYTSVSASSISSVHSQSSEDFSSSEIMSSSSNSVSVSSVNFSSSVIVLSSSSSVSMSSVATGNISSSSTAASSSSQAPAVRGVPENPFAVRYADVIPPNATKVDYDERRFGIITGLIFSQDGTTPLEGVTVVIKDHSEYGSVVSDTAGRYQIATEASGIQIVDFYKTGYTPIQRRVTTRFNQIASTPKITMLEVDSKSTLINLSNPAVQTHTSSTIDDERGERSATIVFDGVHSATVKNSDGSTYKLSHLNVRATEFSTPASMPATLPPTSAFTYCIDVTIDGVDKDAMVYFDNNVSFFIDNFLDVPVGTIVPVGYYDRKQSLWVSMHNGMVVRLLDSDNDGIVEGVDTDDDGVADDINRNGSTEDEATGLKDSTRFIAGSSFTMFYSDHFTSIDSNYGPGRTKSTPPPIFDNDYSSKNQPIPNTCTNSYINPTDQSFHEDVGISGTPYTLWYNSKNTQGYHPQKIQPLTDWIGSLGTMVGFDIAGLQHTRIFQSQSAVDETTFYWDRKDYLGNTATTPKILTVITDKKDIQYHISRGGSGSGSGASGSGAISVGATTYYKIDLFGRDMQTIENAELFTPRLHHSRSYIRSNAYAQISTFPGVDQNNIANGWGFEGIHDTINSLLLKKREQYEVIFKGTYYMPNFIDKSGKKYEHYDRIVVDDFGTIYRKQSSYNYSNRTIYGYITQQKAGSSEVTYIGGGDQVYSEDNVSFTGFKMSKDFDFTLDSYGNLIITDDNKIYKAYHDGRLVLFSGDEANDETGNYKEARFNNPRTPVVDKQGNIYVIDSGNHKIKKLDITGDVTTLIGQDNNNTHSGDYGLASEASMEEPTHLAIDSQNNLYIGFGNKSLYYSASKQERIRVITPQGIIKPVAGELGGIAPWYGNTSVVASYAAMNYMQTSFPLLVGPNDELYVGPYMIHKVSTVPPFDESTQTYRLKEGNQLKIFDTAFKHLQTLNTDTNTTIYSFSYNDASQLTAITDRYGETTQIHYTDATATSITAPNGDETILHVDANRNLTSLTRPDGSTQSFEYNANDLMTAMIEPKGNRFVHMYDEHGRLTAFEDEKGGSWEYESTPNVADRSHTLIQTKAEGSRVEHYFKHHINQTTTYNTLSAEGNEHNITQSATTTTMTSCNTQSTTEPYGEEGIRRTLSYLESPRTYGYSFGKYGYKHASDGISQDVQYIYTDENATLPQSVTYTTTLQSQPYLHYYSSPIIRTTTQAIDYTTNTITQTSPKGRKQSMTFNPLDMQPTKIEAEGSYPITLEYDTQGRLIGTDQESRESAYHYNTKGDFESSIDARGILTIYAYDTMHRMRSITSEGITTEFTYDDNGNLISLTTPNETVFQTTHDSINYPNEATSPLGHTTTYTYDKERRLTQIQKPSGKTVATTYKGKRVESIQGDGVTTNFSYSCGSKLKRISNNEGENISYDYDIYNRMTSQVYSGVVDKNISFAYASYYNNSETLANALIYHLPTSMTYADATQSLEYDADGLLIKSDNTTLSRDIQGRIIQRSDTIGFKSTITYNGYGEADETVTTHNTTTLFTQKILKRDAGGRILSKLEHLNGEAPIVSAYTYDRAGRLIKVQQDATITEQYIYDNNGNRLQEEINTTIGTYNQEDQLKSYGNTEYDYDEDGCLKTKTTPTGTTTYTYGIYGELKSVTLEDGTLIEYKHNINHQRVAKLINGEITEKYLWLNLTTLLATYDKDDNLTSRYMYSSDRVPDTMTQNKQTYHLLYNHQGSLRAVVDRDGTIVKEIQYDSFGIITQDTNPALHVSFGFTGGLYDSDTKLTRFGYRDYDTQTGKWTAKDPIGFGGGDFNLYGYVLGDPVNFVDPSGLYSLNALLHDFSNYSAGFGDAITFGLTKEFRKTYGYNHVVNSHSPIYQTGSYTTLLLGGARLAYAGAAKGISILPGVTGRQASSMRNILKRIFRLNPFSNYRVYPYEKLLQKYGSESAIKNAAGRTSGSINRLGATGFIGGLINEGSFGCQ